MNFLAAALICFVSDSIPISSVRISGKVIDGDGRGKPGVTVQLINAGLMSVTNDSGDWVIENYSTGVVRPKPKTRLNREFNRIVFDFDGRTVQGRQLRVANSDGKRIHTNPVEAYRAAMQMTDTLAFGWYGSIILRDTISELQQSGIVRKFDTTPNPNVIYGYFVDPRDGNQYRTINVGSSTWMAENLNFDTAGASMCLYEKDKNCGIYGRLYNWRTAKNICPTGWHIPDTTEWTYLEEFVGGGDLACRNLESTVGWYNSKGQPTDLIGFSALPGGMYDGGWAFVFNESAFWVNSDYDDGSFAREYNLDHCGGSTSFTRSWWNSMFVRCVKD